ncbi:hypothetical protein BD413DRAFT_308173 [Trametes elegans]|nr:hypothetical protein BD413DRAFT_308173 [Trametes elegans]
MVFSCPLPGTYAVVELDVENTLKSFNDPIAIEEGARIQTTKCIVYINIVLQLPMPGCETFKYMVFLVGPGLRPEVPEACITSDMCIPIYPNTNYPADSLVALRDDIQISRFPFLAVRESLRTEPEFPFSNCCHWFCDRTTLDLRILNEGTDYRAMKLVELPADQHCNMVVFQQRDQIRARRARQEKNPVPVVDPKPEESAREPALSSVHRTEDEEAEFTSSAPGARTTGVEDDADGVFENDLGSEDYDDDEQPGSEYYGSGSECGEDYESDYEARSYTSYDSDGSDGSYGPGDEAQGLTSMDIFGFSLQEQELLMPICKLWLDIGAHFTEETVPNPMDFVEQHDELVRIVRESRERARARARLEIEAKHNATRTDDEECKSNAESTTSDHALANMQSEDSAANKQLEGGTASTEQNGGGPATSSMSPWSKLKGSVLSLLHYVLLK